MPEQYSIKELAAKIRERRPDLSNIPDMLLVGKTLEAAPELKQFLGPEPVTQSPMYPGGPESRTSANVMQDQAANVLSGIPKAITSIPGAIKDVYNLLTSNNPVEQGQILQGAAQSAIQPFVPVAKTIAGKAPLPESPEWTQAAQGAGAMLGNAALAKFGPEAIQAVKGPIQRAAGSIGAKVANSKLFKPTELEPVVPSQVTKPAVPLDAPRINKWMGVASKEVEYGANPGQQLIDENLLGPTKEATRANVKVALRDAGQQMQTALRAADQSGTTIDAQTPLYDSAAKAIKKIGAPKESTFTSQIEGIVDDIESRYPSLDKLTPSDAHSLKVQLGDDIDWHGEAFNSPTNQVLVRIYRSLNDSLKTDVHGLGPMQDRWGNLYSAAKNLKKGMAKDVVGTGTGIPAPADIPAEVSPAIPAKLGPSPAVRYGKNALKYAAPLIVGGEAVRLYRDFTR